MKVLFCGKKAACAVLSAAAVLLLAGLSGCTSTPAAPEPLAEVHPLALLSDDSGIYLHIPVQKHMELTSALLCNQVENLSEANAKRIAQYVEHLYIGIGSQTDGSRLEAAASGTVPQVGLRSVFTEKNGWTQQKYDAKSSEAALARQYPRSFTYYTHKEEAVQLSFLSDTVLCFAQNIFPLLEQYAVRPELPVTDCSKWLQQKGDDIVFYVTQPGTFFESFSGMAIQIPGCDRLYGKMHQLPAQGGINGRSSTYELSFMLHVTDKRTLPGFKSLLSLSLGKMGAKISQADDSTLEVSGISVTQEQIELMFLGASRASRK